MYGFNDENINQLLVFWDFITDGKPDIHCMNSKESFGFSKNFFAKDFERFENWVKQNQDKDVYMNYSPLKTGMNRTNDNVESIKIIGLDIEFKDKEKPEKLWKLDLMKTLIEETIINANQIKNYLLVCSGNGFHLYIPFGAPIVKETEIMKIAYKKTVKQLQDIANNMIENENNYISCDDRIDLAGILRVPTTMNTGAKRRVEIAGYEDSVFTDNKVFRKRLIRNTRVAVKQMKKSEEIRKMMQERQGELKGGIVPETFEELMAHPVTRLIFDYELDDCDGWHQGPYFALQALVKFSGLPYFGEIQDLEKEVNSMWGSSISLKICNAHDVMGPLIATYKFCKKNGFTKYEQELRVLLFSNN